MEQGAEPARDLVDVSGVGGAWWGLAELLDPPFSTRDNSGLHISYLFLDDEPPAVARRLQTSLRRRWSTSAVEPLPALPFHSLVAYDWGRYCP